MYLIDYSKKLDDWIERNTQSFDVGSSGVFHGVDASEVEQKMTLLVDALSDAVSALRCIQQQKEMTEPLYGIDFNRVYRKSSAAGVDR